MFIVYVKDGLISESFSLASNLKKKEVPNHSPEHLFFRWIVLRAVIWHLLFGDMRQSKNFLILNHL